MSRCPQTRGVVFALSLLMSSLFLLGCARAEAPPTPSAAPIRIAPGDARFDLPEFKAFQAHYRSGSAQSGSFSSQVWPFKREGQRMYGVVDTIGMREGLIVAQRFVDVTSMATVFGAGPYFAWGEEFVITRSNNEGYDLERLPLTGGEPIRKQGGEGRHVDTDFSPFLAALMPLPKGTRFLLPKLEPRKAGHMERVWVQHQVVGIEILVSDAGVRCECWVIEEKSTSGMLTRYWVTREPPFVLKRHRDPGGKRDLISDLLRFSFL